MPLFADAALPNIGSGAGADADRGGTMAAIRIACSGAGLKEDEKWGCGSVGDGLYLSSFDDSSQECSR